MTEGEFILNFKTFKRVFIHVFSFCLHPFHNGFGRTHFGRMITHWEITIASKQSAAWIIKVIDLQSTHTPLETSEIKPPHECQQHLKKSMRTPPSDASH